jgi:putative restriction endonuclease
VAGRSNIAKPVLLLAIITLIDKGYITENNIRCDKMLVDVYTGIFQQYSENITSAIYPYYYIRNDGFYSIKGHTDRRTPSEKYIREQIDYAYLDEPLWNLLQDSAIREEFKQKIINHYLKEPIQ